MQYCERKKWNEIKNTQHPDWYSGSIPKYLFLFSLRPNKATWSFSLPVLPCHGQLDNVHFLLETLKWLGGPLGTQEPLVGGPCHVHGLPILRTPGTTAHMQVVGTLQEQPIHLHCLLLFCYFTWIKPKWFSTAEARVQYSAPMVWTWHLL